MEYHITDARYDPNDFIENKIPKLLRQVIISRSYCLKFTLIYDEGFFPDKRWESVIDLLNLYHTSFMGELKPTYLQRITDDTVYDFAVKTSNKPYKYYGEKSMTRDQIKEIFAFVKEKHFPLYEDFHKCSVKKLGGKL